ncbi:hypothetical protein PFISCL1PPCAC_12257, partial [Pristionchus fissidentatus]
LFLCAFYPNHDTFNHVSNFTFASWGNREKHTIRKFIRMPCDEIEVIIKAEEIGWKFREISKTDGTTIVVGDKKFPIVKE